MFHGSAITASRFALSAIADSAKRDAVIADPWDTFGAAQVFGYATELAAMAPRPA